MKRTTRLSTLLATMVLLPVLILALAGCGGGGGSGGGGGGGGGGTVNLTGTLKDTLTGIAITGRTLALQSNPAISAVTDGSGNFQLNGVPSSGVITLTLSEAGGFHDGNISINMDSLSGNPRNAGTVNFDLSSNPPPPPL